MGVALMAGVTGFAWWRSIQTPVADVSPAPDPGVPSIAVLPLVDMSPGQGNEYLGDGLSEELSMRLAQVPGLRVASRTSAFEFKGKALDVRRIGQLLGVRHVLEGSVRRDGDNVRVTVQLVDARTGYHVWAGNFDRGWHDVLRMQDEVARAVTDVLQVVLSPQARQALATPGPADTAALEPYLAGLALLRRPSDLSVLDEAEGRFREAIAAAPSFAPAYAGLCESGAGRFRRTRDPADLREAAAACTRALGLNPQLVETEKALGALYNSGGRFEDAQPIFRRIIERDPQGADGYLGLARACEGRQELVAAEDNYRRAVAAEPSFWNAHNSLGGFLYARGRFDEAIASYRRVTELMPSSALAFNNLGSAFLAKRDFEAAIDAYRKSLALEPSSSAYSNLATGQYYLRRFAEAVGNYTRAAQLAPEDPVLWGNLADALWQMPGRRDAAVADYRKAIVLAERDLERTPDDAVLRAQLGYYFGRAADPARSRELLSEATLAGGSSADVQYFAAVAAADRGDAEDARRAAREAVRLGYPKALLDIDPALATIHRGEGG
jgi:TolB-like protein/Tfp pilus assembly protein PilF